MILLIAGLWGSYEDVYFVNICNLSGSRGSADRSGALPEGRLGPIKSFALIRESDRSIFTSPHSPPSQHPKVIKCDSCHTFGVGYVSRKNLISY